MYNHIACNHSGAHLFQNDKFHGFVCAIEEYQKYENSNAVCEP